MVPGTVNGRKDPNERNSKVYVGKSKIRSSQKGVRVGNGLFINEDVLKGDIICYYGGSLLDRVDAKYESPLYIVEFQKGHVILLGDSREGDLGIFANSIHPLSKSPKQNARFDLSRRKAFNKFNEQVNIFAANDRGIFPIIATKDMAKGEEVIVNYKSSYWRTLEKFKNTPKVQRTESSIKRQLRAEKRRALSDLFFQ